MLKGGAEGLPPALRRGRKAGLVSRAAGGRPARSQGRTAGHTRVASGWRLPGAPEGEGSARNWKRRVCLPPEALPGLEQDSRGELERWDALGFSKAMWCVLAAGGLAPRFPEDGGVFLWLLLGQGLSASCIFL